jgi:hypothetical protein
MSSYNGTVAPSTMSAEVSTGLPLTTGTTPTWTMTTPSQSPMLLPTAKISTMSPTGKAKSDATGYARLGSVILAQAIAIQLVIEY